MILKFKKISTGTQRYLISNTPKLEKTDLTKVKYNFNTGVPYNFVKDQKLPSIQKEYQKVDYEAESPAIQEKNFKTGKFAYLKMLELMLNCPGKLIQKKFDIQIESVFEQRISQFRNLMERQGTELNLALVREKNGEIKIKEMINPNEIKLDDIEDEIDAIFNGCIKVLNVSTDRSQNLKFNEYNVDLSQEGVIMYEKKERKIPDEILTEFQRQQKTMEESLADMNETQQKQTRNKIKVKKINLKELKILIFIRKKEMLFFKNGDLSMKAQRLKMYVTLKLRVFSGLRIYRVDGWVNFLVQGQLKNIQNVCLWMNILSCQTL